VLFFFSILKEEHPADGSNMKCRPINKLHHRHPNAIYETLIKKQLQRKSNDILLVFVKNYSLPTAAKQNTDPSIRITFIRQCQTLNKKTAPTYNSINNICAFLFTLLK